MATFSDTLGTEDSQKEEPAASASSSDWSDEEGDEYLAKALASDPYLQDLKASAAKSSPEASEPPYPTETSAAADGEATQTEDASITSTTTSTSTAAPAAGRTLLVHHPLCELHSIPDHPERPGRVRAIMNVLTREFPDFCPQLAPEATLEQVLRFHDRPHVNKIDRVCSEAEERGRAAEAEAEALLSRGTQPKRPAPPGGKGQRGSRRRADIVSIDPDTSVMPASRAAIWRAAGAACFAVDEVMSERATNAFCCVRPPGHHAEPDHAMGFCFFNNAPIGALHAQAAHGVERVAVVDIDVHHGNGTQAFFRNDPTTFYASTHQGPNFYPGTGQDFIKGVEGNVLNVSMRDGEGSREFRRAYSEKILPALEAFRPGLIFISAGFDAHEDDPLAGISLNELDYHWVTQEICAVAQKVCGGRVVSILEGGYNLQAIANSSVAHVLALREAAAAAAAEVAGLSTSPGAVTATAPESLRGGGGEGVDVCLVDDGGGLTERLEAVNLVGEEADGKGEDGSEGRDGGRGRDGDGGSTAATTPTTVVQNGVSTAITSTITPVADCTAAGLEGSGTAAMVAAPSSGPATAEGGGVGFPEALPPVGVDDGADVVSRGDGPPPLPPRPQQCLSEGGGEEGGGAGEGGVGETCAAATGPDEEEDMDEAFARLSVRDAVLLKEAPGDGEDVFRPV